MNKYTDFTKRKTLYQLNRANRQEAYLASQKAPSQLTNYQVRFYGLILVILVACYFYISYQASYVKSSFFYRTKEFLENNFINNNNSQNNKTISENSSIIDNNSNSSTISSTSSNNDSSFNVPNNPTNLTNNNFVNDSIITSNSIPLPLAQYFNNESIKLLTKDLSPQEINKLYAIMLVVLQNIQNSNLSNNQSFSSSLNSNESTNNELNNNNNKEFIANKPTSNTLEASTVSTSSSFNPFASSSSSSLPNKPNTTNLSNSNTLPLNSKSEVKPKEPISSLPTQKPPNIPVKVRNLKTNINYYLGYLSNNSFIRFRPVTRSVTFKEEVLSYQTIINELLTIPSNRQFNQINLLDYSIKLRNMWIDDQVLILDFNAGFEYSRYGYKGLSIRIQQILWTLFSFSTAKAPIEEKITHISFLINGKRKQKISAYGLELKPFYSKKDLLKRIEF